MNLPQGNNLGKPSSESSVHVFVLLVVFSLRISMSQKLVLNKFQTNVHTSQMDHARRNGNKDLENKLRVNWKGRGAVVLSNSKLLVCCEERVHHKIAK